jgi:hypothetical protein
MKGWGRLGRAKTPFGTETCLQRTGRCPILKKDDMNENQEFRALII